MIPRLLTIFASVLLATAAIADSDNALPLWRVSGAHNDVYLLASVHLLRPSDYPLPVGIDIAYDDAETLVMELDMDDLDQAEAATLVSELGEIKDGRNLAMLMGTADFARATQLANKAAIPLEAFAGAEPWLAAITTEEILLTRLGFESSLGLEQQLMKRAVADGKEIRGLETLREQLEILDRLPLAVQRRLLLQTLEEGVDIESVMDELLSAWRRGDADELARTVLADMREEPLLYRELVVRRNRNWVTQISELLQHEDDYLVIVGALHLVGDDGVPGLLERRGFKVSQMRSATVPGR
ncbi:MAG: TraB/GumN family protein [Woeseia sp.]